MSKRRHLRGRGISLRTHTRTHTHLPPPVRQKTIAHTATQLLVELDTAKHIPYPTLPSSAKRGTPYLFVSPCSRVMRVTRRTRRSYRADRPLYSQKHSVALSRARIPYSYLPVLLTGVCGGMVKVRRSRETQTRRTDVRPETKRITKIPSAFVFSAY